MMPSSICRELPKDFDEAVAAMLTCEQSAGQSVYQHGKSVSEFYRKLLIELENDSISADWKLPDWFFQYKDKILTNLHDQDIILLYTLYHDIGKPYCRMEENGKIHFPDHAAVSAYIWKHIGGEPLVGHLIAHDMTLHTSSAIEIAELLGNCLSCKDSITLLFVGLCELHSNAMLFGGFESINFKIKIKQLSQRGKQICKYWFG